MIYLDYAASTPVDNKVLDLFCDITKKHYANPNSSHRLGIEAKKMIDNATNSIAHNLGISTDEIIYTSGASEANNLAIKGICQRYKNRGKHILISGLEHNSITSSLTTMQEAGFEVEIIPVNRDGLIDIESLKRMIRNDTILVSICSVDSEIGIRQNIEDIGLLLKDYPNCIFHTDSSQAFGKVKIDYTNVDLITITPHKFYGLNGISILVKKKNISLRPQIDGGKSTTIYRSGTPNLASIVACSKIIEIAIKELDKRYEDVKKLNNRIINNLSTYKNVNINSTVYSIPHIINFSIKNVKAMDIQKKLEKYDIYVSTKTSCCPIETPSKLVYALTKDKGLSSSSIRLSLSHLTTNEEIDKFLEIFSNIYKEYEQNGKI